jgi:predicted metalloprotease
MLWQGRRASGNVLDQRSLGGKGPLGVGGLLIGAVVYYLMGGNPLDYVAQNTDTSRMSGSATSSARQGSPAEEEQKNFASVVLADTEDVWTEQFSRNSRTYQPPKMVLFRGRTKSGCGSASSQVGPFYCPTDQRVYLDLSFFDEMSSKLGARGDTAAAYVIAHEVGHHVQHLLGFDRISRSNQASVSLELQADCLAGVWATQIEKSKSVMEEGDIEEALGAASAVGDDRLQSLGGGEVQPESFTHGSSAQRVAAFRQGYEGGSLSSCVRR